MLTLLLPAFAGLIFWESVAGAQCSAGEGANFDLVPQFWCSLIANVSIGNECSTNVQEQILLPWATGLLRRDVPHQSNQRIFGITATEQVAGKKTELHVERVRAENGYTTLLKIRTGRSQQPKTITLQYRIERGVTTDARCQVFTFGSKQPPQGMSTMIVKWAIGAGSVENVQHVETHFSLVKNSRHVYLDSEVKHPDDFELQTVTVTNDPTKSVRVSHIGESDHMHPAQFIFYFRFALAYGWAQCPNPRECEQEVELLQKAKSKGISSKLIIGLSVGGGLAAILVAFTVWVCCTRSRNDAGDRIADNTLGHSSSRLPDSLRHFAYDTGDEHSSKKWKEWTEASPKRGEEIRAIELSPRNRRP